MTLDKLPFNKIRRGMKVKGVTGMEGHVHHITDPKKRIITIRWQNGRMTHYPHTQHDKVEIVQEKS